MKCFSSDSVFIIVILSAAPRYAGVAVCAPPLASFRQVKLMLCGEKVCQKSDFFDLGPTCASSAPEVYLVFLKDSGLVCLGSSVIQARWEGPDLRAASSLVRSLGVCPHGGPPSTQVSDSWAHASSPLRPPLSIPERYIPVSTCMPPEGPQIHRVPGRRYLSAKPASHLCCKIKKCLPFQQEQERHPQPCARRYPPLKSFPNQVLLEATPKYLQ